MTKQNDALKQVFKAAGANICKLSLLNNSTLMIRTRSYNACTKSLQVARVLGFKITHGAQRSTIFTKNNKAIQGYIFMAKIETPEKMVAGAKIILAGISHPDATIEAINLSQNPQETI